MTVFRSGTCADSARSLKFPFADPPARHHVRSKKLLMFPRASRSVRDRTANCAVVACHQSFPTDEPTDRTRPDRKARSRFDLELRTRCRLRNLDGELSRGHGGLRRRSTPESAFSAPNVNANAESPSVSSCSARSGMGAAFPPQTPLSRVCAPTDT